MHAHAQLMTLEIIKEFRVIYFVGRSSYRHPTSCQSLTEAIGLVKCLGKFGWHARIE